MSERNDRDERNSERRAAEGVRIIGPEEAQAALDAGQAAGRRADDELRFGDVPPAPPGPRPPHRFPLPDSVDPAAAVPRPPLAVVQPPASVVPPVPSGAHSIGAAGVHRPGVEAHDDEHTAPLPLAPGLAEPPTARSAPPAHDPPGHAPPAYAPPAHALPEDALPEDALPAHAPSAHDPTTHALSAHDPTTHALSAHDPTGGPPMRGSVPPAPGPPLGGAVSYPAEPAAWEPSGSAAVGDRGARWTPEGYGRQPSGPQPAPYQGPWSERPWSERPPLPTVPAASEPTVSPSSWTPPPYVPVPAPSGPGPVPPPAGSDPALTDQGGPHREHNEGMTVTGGSGAELPHWTDPPTGEVPRIRPESGAGDDLAAWEALGARGTRWRDDSKGWERVDELDDLADEEAPVGVLDQTRAEHSDLYSFDEEFERLEEERSGSHRALDDDYEDFEDEEEPVVVGAGSAAARPVRSGAVRSRMPGPGGRPPGGAGADNDLGSRAAVGVGLVVLLLIAYALGSLALLVLSAAVVVAAAVEVYSMLQHSGFRPATLLGLVATAGIMFAAYWRGIGALGLLVALMFVVTMLWYLLGIVEARPLANVAVTLVAFVWVGVLGSYAALLLRAHHGRGLFVGAILPAVAADIVAYFVGRRVGSRLLAPSVSPAKTLEGVLGGGAAAIVVGLIVGHWISPWGGIKHGLLLGLAVAILAPVGDLFESMIKRDLSVKDSGTALPGHGGVLDRFDSVLLVMPAAFYLASLFNVVR